MRALYRVMVILLNARSDCSEKSIVSKHKIKRFFCLITVGQLCCISNRILNWKVIPSAIWPHNNVNYVINVSPPFCLVKLLVS